MSKTAATRSPSAAPAADEKRVLVGRIGVAHGVKGETRLMSFTEDSKAIGAYGPLTDARGALQFEITELRPLKENLFVVRIAGITTREAAEALTNTDLYVARDAFAPTAEEEFYRADLIGLAARNAAGEHVGHVVHVLNFGGGDILEIQPAPGGETLLVPFTKEAVPVIDVAGGAIVIVPPVEIEAVEPGVAQEAAPRGARASSR
jgi:16S rRNA processing protein RimM